MLSIIAPKLIKTRNLIRSDNYKYDSVKFHRTKVKSGTKGASGRNFEEGRITITFFGYSSCKFRSYVDFLLSSFKLVSCVGTLTLLFYTVPWDFGLHQSVGMILFFNLFKKFCIRFSVLYVILFFLISLHRGIYEIIHKHLSSAGDQKQTVYRNISSAIF